MKHALYSAMASLLLLTTLTACSHPYGMGPGGGGGGSGMGPGMMGGPGHYGMGPGMMGGHGPGGSGLYGMGPGMMGHHDGGPYRNLDLSADQRRKINEIMREAAQARWALMGTMHQQDSHMDGMHGAGLLDEQEARKAFEAMSDAHKAMFELQLAARKRIDAVLTPEQRDKLRGR